MLFLASLVGAVFALRYAIETRVEPMGRARRFAAWATPVGLLAVALAFAPRGYELTKSIGGMVMPLGLVWCALLALAVGAAWRRRYRLALVFAGLWVALTLATNGPLSQWLGGIVEGEHARARPFDEGPFEAVIVLGGGTSETPRGDLQLGTAGDRVMLGARLYLRGRTPLLVTSGAPIAGLSAHDSGRASAALWGELGIPEEAIVVVEGARTTSEEAVIHARNARARGWDRIGLVSSAWHLPRALPLFEAEGLRVTPLPADVRSRPPEWRGFIDLVPSGPSAYGIHKAAWELVGRAVGR